MAPEPIPLVRDPLPEPHPQGRLIVPRTVRSAEAGFPGFVSPMLSVLVDAPPAGEGWLHEIKHDGNRTLIVVDRGTVRAFTRRGLDWSKEYGRLCEGATKLKCRSAILDGEAIVQGEDGRSDFTALRRAIHQEPHRLVFFAFDLLHLDGEDLRPLPLLERKARLAKLIGKAKPSSCIQYSEALAGDGQKIFAAAEAMSLEGIVSKRATSRYVSGKSTAWVKTKCMTEGEFWVVGAEPNPGGAPFALLAREEPEGLTYAGSAFVTLDAASRDRFWTGIERLRIARPVVPQLRGGNRKAAWVKPEMRVRARHLKGGGDMLRHGALTKLL